MNMENNKNSLEEFTKEILDTAEKFFELKNSENYFIPGISSIPVSGKVLDSDDLKTCYFRH